MMILKNAMVFVNDTGFEKTDLMLEKGRIAAMGDFQNSEGMDSIDCNGKMIIPGLIDIHSHGREGWDYEDGDMEAVENITKSQLKQGVTSVLATTITQSEEEITKMLRAIAGYKGTAGAEILGINLEGPFVNPEVCGAQPKEFCIAPDLEMFQRFQEAAEGKIRLVTVAPEYPNALEFMQKCGVCVSAGHTKATVARFNEALTCGLRSVTHLFNGMPSLHHREPGVVGGALVGDNYAEIICDYIHLAPAVIELTYKMKGAKRLIMVSDSMRAAGLSDGSYVLGGAHVTVTDGIARLDSGTLAGSTASLKENMGRLYRQGIPQEDIIRMCTSTPAAMLGITDRGIICAGMAADLVVMEEGFAFQQVYKAGKRVV